MQIKYLDGPRLKAAVIAGSQNLIANKSNLNNINVFPVPDGDTGTNMASTMHAVIDALNAENSTAFADVSLTISNRALEHAHGNSGVILAQFFQGLTEKVIDRSRISAKEFTDLLHSATELSYSAMLNPQEGTILSVIRVLSETWADLADKIHDFSALIDASLERCKQEVVDSPKKLDVLRVARVVDAGALGFVHMLEGMSDFIRTGKLRSIQEQAVGISKLDKVFIDKQIAETLTYQFCTECLVEGSDIPRAEIAELLGKLGDSIILAGGKDRLKLHIHTNQPEKIFQVMEKYGQVGGKKADDMKAQVAENSKGQKIAVVVDSLADLPEDILNKYDIHVVPIRIQFGNQQFTDRVNLDTRTFYEKLRTSEEFPKTSQPPPADFINLYKHLIEHNEHVISLHISSKLSGTYASARSAAEQINGDRIQVIDTKSGGLAQGIIALRAAELIDQGTPLVEVLKEIEKLIRNRKILILFKTLEYIIKGGRLNGKVGSILTRLNLMPLITYTPDGSLGRAGFIRQNDSSIPKLITKMKRQLKGTQPTEIGVMHAADPQAAAIFQLELEEAFPNARYLITEIGPGIGSYAGPGALAVVYFDR